LSADIHIIAFTHRILSVAQIGSMQKSLETLEKGLMNVKSALDWTECMALATCNRVEITFISARPIQTETVEQLLFHLCSHLPDAERRTLAIGAQTYSGLNAVRHFFEVASSLDSLVIGEREIITQVRESFERCRIAGLTGDSLRLLLRFTIETAKRVFTETEIANRPVSVVSLAFHELVKWSLPPNPRVLMIGAGVTNTAMVRFLYKHGLRNITIYNRTPEKALALAAECGGRGKALSELDAHSEGFDVLISCTGSPIPLVDATRMLNWMKGDDEKKWVVDLALPGDIDRGILSELPVHFIGMEHLQEVAKTNLQAREQELSACRNIIDEGLDQYRIAARHREVELAMQAVPEAVKHIRTIALEQVFAKELEQMDPSSVEVLERVVDYLEKKYISVPMRMAKSILLDRVS
jgi:glutamyl-tRNA reductase